LVCNTCSVLTTLFTTYTVYYLRVKCRARLVDEATMSHAYSESECARTVRTEYSVDKRTPTRARTLVRAHAHAHASFPGFRV
jgi:hypothetical protein